MNWDNAQWAELMAPRRPHSRLKYRLDLLVAGSEVKVYQATDTRRWHWSVLVPPVVPKVPGHGNRPLVDSGSGRHWYDGGAGTRTEATAEACAMFGEVMGAWLAWWMGPHDPPAPERVPPLRRLS